MRRRLFRVSVIIVVAATVLAFVSVRSFIEQPEPIRIAVIIPLTGSNAYMSEARDAMVIAADEINRWGGVSGRSLEIIFADSESNPELAKQEFTRLNEEYEPILFISALSSVSLVLADLAEEAEVPLLGLLTSVGNFTEGRDWVFRYYFQTESEASPIVEALSDLGVSSVGIIRSDDVYGTEIAELVKEGFEARGGSVEIVPVAGSDTDFADEVANASDNDAIYVATLRGQLVPVLTDINLSGFQGPVLAVSGASAPSVRLVPEVEGVYTASPLLYNHAYHLGTALIEKFQDRYDTLISHQGATGYDVVRLIAGLLDNQNVSREGLRMMLGSGFVFTGTLGIIEVSQGEHEFNFLLYPSRVEGGEVVYL